MFKGREIKRLALISALCCVALILSVSLYLMFSSRSNLREQTDRMKAAMSENIAQHLQKCLGSMYEGLRMLDGIEIGSGLSDFMANQEALYDFFAKWVLLCYDAEFVAYYNGDDLLASVAKPGAGVPGADFRPSGEEEYEIVDHLGEAEGTFFLFDKKSVLPGDRVVYAIDNTAQIDSMRAAYEDEKSSMVWEQVIMVGIIFLALLAGSLLLIRFLIIKWLGRPIGRLSEEARSIIAGQVVEEEEEVHEGSLFANLQRLVNSGRAVFVRSGQEASAGNGAERAVGSREVNKVITTWALIVAALFLVSTVVTLIFSITMMGSKSDDIMENVSEEMAVYYSGAYDSLTSMAVTGADLFVSKDVFDPDTEIDREKVISGINDVILTAFGCEIAGNYLETDKGGYNLNSAKPGVALEFEPGEMGDPLTTHEDFFRQGDTVMIVMNRTEYPGYLDQFGYFIIDVTQQAEVLDQLYDDGSSSLMASQLVLLLFFLALGLVVSALAMAWAVRKFITRPILKLDALSNRLMEGDLDVEVAVDEESGFADMQRLLKKTQELLGSMMEGEPSTDSAVRLPG